MSDLVFQEAYGRVRGRHTNQEWFSMTPQQITEVLYREIRAVDQERSSVRMRDAGEIHLIAAE